MESNIMNLKNGPKYNPLKKLANAANKAQNSKELIGVLPEFEKVVNSKVEEVKSNAQMADTKEESENRSLFSKATVRTVLGSKAVKEKNNKETKEAYVR